MAVMFATVVSPKTTVNRPLVTLTLTAAKGWLPAALVLSFAPVSYIGDVRRRRRNRDCRSAGKTRTGSEDITVVTKPPLMLAEAVAPEPPPPEIATIGAVT